jgi:hypothetical protein
MFHFGLNASDLRRIVWTAIGAFASVYVLFASGIGQYANFSEAKAAALALLPAAIAAAISAIKNGVLSDGSAIK